MIFAGCQIILIIRASIVIGPRVFISSSNNPELANLLKTDIFSNRVNAVRMLSIYLTLACFFITFAMLLLAVLI